MNVLNWMSDHPILTCVLVMIVLVFVYEVLKLFKGKE